MIEIIEVIIETGGVPFSPKIDKSVDILRSIENGRSIGSVETLLNICNVLDITLDYMFYDLLNKKSEILDNKMILFQDSTIVD